jgi:hypothetical protein
VGILRIALIKPAMPLMPTALDAMEFGTKKQYLSQKYKY